MEKSAKISGKDARNHNKKVENFPLISVIIPVYNVQNYLERCLESVKKQSYANLEIILVDDGSTDRSGELCDQIAKTDARITTIHQQNQGLSAARNAALEIIHGEYVTFVDSDDTVSESMVAKLYDLCFKNHTLMSICSFQEVFPEKLRYIDFSTHWPESPKTDTVLDTPACLKAMLLEQGFTVSAWGKLYHRELFKDVRFPVGALHEDVGTTYQLVLKCPQIAFSPSPEYNYYQNQDSITKQKFSPTKLSLIALTDKMCDEINSVYPELQQVTAERRMHARFSILRQFIFVKEPNHAIKKIEKDMIYYLKTHKNDILKNPYATSRDKIALTTLLISKQLFKLGWKVYSHE